MLAIRDEGGLRIGQPLLAAASVTAEILGPKQGPKLVVQKFRRRKKRPAKDRPPPIYTRVKISKIIMDGAGEGMRDEASAGAGAPPAMKPTSGETLAP